MAAHPRPTIIAVRLINPPGFSDLAEQVAKLVPVKPSDLGNPVDVSDQVRFRPDEELVCYLTRWPGENAAVRRDEQFLDLGDRPVLVE